MSGRWFLLSFFLGLAGSSLASPTPKVDPTRDASIAAEQQRVFGLSVSPRLLPNESWFIDNDNGRNSGLTDPMQKRWARDPYAIPTRPGAQKKSNLK